MNLTPDEVRAAYYCVASEVRRRIRAGQPVQPWLRTLFDRLGAEVSMSRPRHDFRCDERQSEPEDMISSREAAVILGKSKRQVHRIAEALEGRIVDKRWVFERSVVERYAKERRDGQAAGGGGGVVGRTA